MSDTGAAPFLSVVIPVHNQTDLLKKLLRSIRAEGMAGELYEVIVTDDGSKVAVSAEIGADGEGVTFIRHDRPKGAAAARNAGSEAARGEVILFLDADTILEKGAMRRAYDRFRAEPDLGAVNGGAAEDPANMDEGFTPKYRALLDHIQQNRRAPESCSFFTPRVGAVRKKYFEAAGRFDPTRPGAGVEEYEFGHRLSRQCAIRFDPRINVLHHYQQFRKNTRNYYVRTRLWMPLFWGRRKFENFGSVTGSYGFGSVFGAIAAVAIPFGAVACPVSACVGAASFVFFCIGYRELFAWTMRLKGPVFLIQSVILSWWLCIFITAGALAGTADVFLFGKKS